MATPAQIWSFLQAVIQLHRKAGGRLLPIDKVKERFEICKTCEHFTGRGCELCGCCTGRRKSLFNKLAYPTQSCPDNPPRWNAEE